MNYLFLVLEVLIVFLLMVIFYKVGKKDGLYLYICLMSAILCALITESIDILSFKVNISIPIIMGIFICSNIIIQRFGIDEVKRILYTFGSSYVMTFIIITLVSLTLGSEYNMLSNENYNGLFGYSLDSIRCFVGNFISIIIMISIGSGIYYSIRKSKNILVISNVITTFVISFIESLIFVMISYIGNFSAIELLGMASIRYVIEVIIGIVGCIPVYILVKFIDK